MRFVEDQTRRDVLRKVAVGGAVAWTTPSILSSSAAALGTLPCDLVVAWDRTTCDPESDSATVYFCVQNAGSSVFNFDSSATGCGTQIDHSQQPLGSGSALLVDFVVDDVSSVAPCYLIAVFRQLDPDTGDVVCQETMPEVEVVCG